jgi:hypothetical protein
MVVNDLAKRWAGGSDPPVPTIAGFLSHALELRPQPIGDSAGDLCRHLVRCSGKVKSVLTRMEVARPTLLWCTMGSAKA